MAGQSGKRIKRANKKSVTQLSVVAGLANIIRLAALVYFRDGWVLYLITSLLSASMMYMLWMSMNEESALLEYAKDVLWVIAFTHITSVLSSKMWWTLAIIPLYIVFKLGSFVLPFFSGRGMGGLGGLGGAATGNPGNKTEESGLSKRQEKMRKKQEKYSRPVYGSSRK